MQMAVGWVVIGLTVAGCAAAGGGTVRIPLPVEGGQWRQVVFAEEVPTDEAAQFAVVEDPEHGPCLAVGPWRAGQWSARFEYAEPLPHTKGTVRGLYRTESLRDGMANVYAGFYAGERRLYLDREALEAAEVWTPFAFEVRRAPVGAEVLVPGFGLGHHAEGRVLFAELSFSPGVEPVEFPDELPPVTRPSPPERLRASGFFRLEEAGDAWWLVTPDGEPFYSVGTVGPSWPRGEGEVAEGRRHAELVRELGFNSLAGWTNIWRWRHVNDALAAEGGRPLPVFCSLQTPSLEGCDFLLEADGRTTGDGHAFPDPFDPRFEAAYREAVAQISQMVRGKAWFAGWFADNEVSHRRLYLHVHSEHCAAALRAWLAERHGEVAGLNRAWGAAFGSFDDLPAGLARVHTAEGPVHEDLLGFEREIVRRYIETTLRAIRSEDPDHLVFSNRFMLGDAADWPRVLDLYAAYDGVAVNLYPKNREPGLSAREREVLEGVHRATGRPLIIGEWSIPAVDSGLYDGSRLDWSWDEAVETQGQRARQAARVSVDFYNLPFLVGAHWFTWRDFDSERRRANRGLFGTDGRPWAELQQHLARAHRHIAAASEPR
jgi:hypothetical protein